MPPHIGRFFIACMGRLLSLLLFTPPWTLGEAGLMDPKEQLRQVEAEMAKDEAEAKRLSRSGSAGGTKPPSGGSSGGGSSGGGSSGGSEKRASKGRVYWLAVLMLLIAAALAISRAMDDRDVERLQLGFLTGGSGLLIGYVLGRRQ